MNSGLVHGTGHSGKIEWSAPSNIALVKYWGKLPGQLPANPNLSMTLSRSVTRTILSWEVKSKPGLEWSFLFEGREAPAFHPKISAFLESVKTYLPFLDHLKIRIDSENTFPHSSGIASSASSMMALACCLVGAGEILTDKKPDDHSFRNFVSFLARIGSGSASRSVWPGFAEWGYLEEIENSSNEYAVPLNHMTDPWFQGLRDAILIVRSGKKTVSSTTGHGLMNAHPYASARYIRAKMNMLQLIEALKKKDPAVFTRVVENEALDLHGLMLSSDPGFYLLEPGTLEIIKRIKRFRGETGIFSAFTLDAGPNVHLLYHSENRNEMEGFINEALEPLCEEGKIIWDKRGDGPIRF